MISAKTSSIFVAVILMLVTSLPASASPLGEINKTLGRVVNEAERFRNRVKRETGRFVNRLDQVDEHFEAELKRWRENGKKAKEKLRAVADEATKVVDEVKELSKSIERDLDNVGQSIEHLVKAIDDIELRDGAIEGTVNRLVDKLSSAATPEEINKFLDKEFVRDVRFIDVLFPLKGGVERIDPTGLSRRVREKSIEYWHARGKAELQAELNLFLTEETKAANGALAVLDSPEELEIFRYSVERDMLVWRRKAEVLQDLQTELQKLRAEYDATLSRARSIQQEIEVLTP